MFKRTFLFTVLALAAAAGLAPAQQTQTYGWEDGGFTSLGTYGNVGVQEVVTDVVHSGTYALHMTEDPVGGTPQVFLAWVGGLQDGDQITCSFWTYDDTPGASPSSRIWGHYTTSDDITNYTGSAGGNDTYSAGNGWEEQSFTWTFDGSDPDHQAFVLEFRMYSSTGAVDYWVDDVTVTAPEYAQIIFPNMNPVTAEAGTWSGVKALYR